MKLITFLQGDQQRLGAIVGENRVCDLQQIAHQQQRQSVAFFASMLDLIEAGPQGLEEARRLVEGVSEESLIDIDQVNLLAPIPKPPQMRDFLVFEKHYQQAIHSSIRLRAQWEGKDPEKVLEQAKAAGMGSIPDVWYERPIYYKANRFAVTGPDRTVDWPSYSMLMDYECELACVIGRQGKNISKKEATSHIFGYTIFNDLSARDAQGADMQGMLGPAKGKDFDDANVLGPYLVTADEVGDPYELEMIVRINGQEVSRGSSSTMHWSFEQMIEFVSQSETLYPGEILGSGTVGDGCGFEHMRFLDSGDVVELEITKLGVLKTTVVGST